MNFIKQLALVTIAGAAAGAVIATVCNSKAKKVNEEPVALVRKVLLSIDDETIELNYSVIVTKELNNISIIKGDEFVSSDVTALREIALITMTLGTNYTNFIGTGSIEERVRRAMSYKSSTTCKLRNGVVLSVKMG